MKKVVATQSSTRVIVQGSLDSCLKSVYIDEKWVPVTKFTLITRDAPAEPEYRLQALTSNGDTTVADVKFVRHYPPEIAKEGVEKKDVVLMGSATEVNTKVKLEGVGYRISHKLVSGEVTFLGRPSGTTSATFVNPVLVVVPSSPPK